MMIHLMTEGQRAAGLPAWEAGSATPDFPRGIAWPQTSPGFGHRWEEKLSHAVAISVALLPGLRTGQRWRNKENKDQTLLQAARTDTEGCSLHDLRLSSPRFSACKF